MLMVRVHHFQAYFFDWHLEFHVLLLGFEDLSHMLTILKLGGRL
jgi:hypothetical protein